MDNVRPFSPRAASSGSRRGRTRRRVAIAGAAAAVAILLGFAARLLGLYIDWLWFGEVDYRSVFWTRLTWEVIAFALVFLLFLVVTGLNVELARRLAPGYRATANGELLEPRSDSFRRYVALGSWGVCVLVAVFAAIAAADRWQTILLFLNRTSFGAVDPVFGRDAGFYIFALPFWEALHGWLMSALIASLVLAAIVHLLMGGVEYTAAPQAEGGGEKEGDTNDGGGIPSPFGRRVQGVEIPRIPKVSLRPGGRAIAHVSAILAAIFILVGVGQLFWGWNLLYSTAGVVYGAGNTDINVRLLMARVTLVVAFALAGLLIWNVWRRRRWWLLAIPIWIAVLIVVRGIVPVAYQSLVVNPNQLSKEREYIGYNMEATRAAYDLDKITAESLAAESPLTVEKLDRNAPTLRNIRLWDPTVLTTSYRQLQGLRPYYIFVDSDVDRYTINGVYRQTMLAARELNIEGLPAAAQTWVNQHITYTHGFGVAMSAVNQVTKDGSPDFLVQDVPPRSVKGLEITEPRIYYGERGTSYTLVKTDEDEFDYPGKSGDVFREYDGTGGISVAPLFNRLAFSAEFGTIKFFTTSSLNSESRIIIRNNITDRVRAAAPFLRLDSDPYMIISDGRLWWMMDAYTVTSLYPYSTPESGVNYIRNSVKVVVDAYNGEMKFYVVDDQDPLLRAYRNAFPDLFTDGSEMPDELMAHVRYPEGIFRIQSNVYATYHVESPDVLYNKGDQWEIPGDPNQGGEGVMPALYVIMRLPNENNVEFLQMLPFVPNGRTNMISWLGARSDSPHYGEIVNIRFSESTTVVGPAQVEGFINQDPEIAAQRTLWDQQGSEVVMGSLLVVPIEDQLLYVQPLYLQSQQTQLPQLKRVIVFYRAPGVEGENDVQQFVAMEPTLGEALAAAFGQQVEDDGATAGDGGDGTSDGGEISAAVRRLIARANDEFEAAQAALKDGDFAEYGRQVEALQATLQQLEKLR